MNAEPQALPSVDLARYFARIGFAPTGFAPTGPDRPAPADMATLGTLHGLHTASIPFEAIDVLLGRGVDLAPEAVDAKILAGHRGGYCFEQNGLFRRVLATLGYRVEPLMARVLWNRPAGAPAQPRTHMVLRVDHDGTPWLLDVGFGSVVPTAPLRLDTDAAQDTPHDSFRVVPSANELLLQVRRHGDWLPVYQMSQDRPEEADFEAANWYTSTHPSSHFARSLIVARVDPEARFTLLNDRLTVRRPGLEPEIRQLDADGIERALDGVFGLPVAADWRPVIERTALAG